DVGVFLSSRRRHTRLVSDWSSDVCSSDLMFLSDCTPRSVTFRIACCELARRQAQRCRCPRVLRGFLAGQQRDAVAIEASFVMDQIGRASCREGGYMAGVGVCVKKKKKTDV